MMKDMAETFFFYDLETSGLDPRRDRIMQFAGQRTTMDLDPIGEPFNILVRLNDDVLPSPDAVMVTGITPQKTHEEGIAEAEFIKLFHNQVCTPGTVTVGFNNIRFDDEFIRFALWRNFHDPYEWAWKDGRSRWDLLDVVRMTRALRPGGIVWPVDKSDKPTNRLELLTSENNLEHSQAHDALSDVYALIAITRMVRDKQPKLFEYLFSIRDKKAVTQLVNPYKPKPIVYTSGRYDANYHKTSVVFPIAEGSRPGTTFVYDLRHNPQQFTDLSPEEIKKRLLAKWEERKDPNFVAIPVKEVTHNRAPAVAPLGVLEQGGGWENIQLTNETVRKHLEVLQRSPDLVTKIKTAYESRSFPKSSDAEAQLYDSFLNDKDKTHIQAVRNASERELADFHPEFNDKRLPPLLIRYKARNFPRSLSEEEQVEWEAYRATRLQAELPGYMGAIARIAKTDPSENTQFLLQELQLWAESIVPVDL
ncbi:Exodeoxyribonuclease I [candidate division TM7 genomosp. GTL1]|nr:Exodeoxyribonuclease I [candidate division TM7 genomosp. GTL1]